MQLRLYANGDVIAGTKERRHKRTIGQRLRLQTKREWEKTERIELIIVLERPPSITAHCFSAKVYGNAGALADEGGKSIDFLASQRQYNSLAWWKNCGAEGIIIF